MTNRANNLVLCTACYYEEAYAHYPGTVPKLALYRVVEPIFEIPMDLCEKHYQQLASMTKLISVIEL